MRLFPRLRLRGTIRTLAQIARALEAQTSQLTRIADALTAAQPQEASPDVSAEVESPDTRQQARYDAVERGLLHRLGRAPDAEEVLAEYDQVKHLM